MQEVNKPILFHQPDFIFRDKTENVISFQNRTVAIYFTKKNHALVSLSKSPFGGIVLLNNDSDIANETGKLFEEINSYVISNGIRSVQVTCSPLIYQPVNGELIVREFLKAGYSILYKDIAQVLVVNNNPLKLNTLRKRSIRQSIESGFVFYELKLNQLPQAYDLFVESRKRKGYPVTMTLDELTRMFILFPQQYKLMGVFDNGKLIAACVVIWVSPAILYYFYVGDDSEYRKCSPVTYLIENVYTYAQKQGATLFDLGISTDAGVLNVGLYGFKKSFGAVDSAKYTFVKNFVNQ